MRQYVDVARSSLVKNLCDPITYIQEIKPDANDYIASQEGDIDTYIVKFDTLGYVQNYSRRERIERNIPLESVKITIPADCLNICPCVGDCIIADYCVMPCAKGRKLRVTDIVQNHVHGIYEIQATPS